MSVNIVGWIAQFEKTALNSTPIKKKKSVDTMGKKNEKAQQLRHFWSGLDAFRFGKKNKSGARRDIVIVLWHYDADKQESCLF